ncbi:uncharacterized protein [Aristolochia californica]|uniref:uncharacterized protein n=1 Tax=Aristolochia californica TaxID=171875 RepID=UPI0035D53082
MSVLLLKPKKPHAAKIGGRLLITINVLGSSGPLRFLVNEGELVDAVIDTALRYYAREGRLPVLGSDLDNFLLYSANAAGADALSPWEPIGSRGARTFLLCKKQQQQGSDEGARAAIGRKGNGSWKSWINKSLSFKISSH